MSSILRRGNEPLGGVACAEDAAPGSGETLSVLPSGSGPRPSSAGSDEGGAVLTDLPVIARESYEVVEERGRGGLGRVLEARDRRLDRRVALKESLRRGDYGAGARFLREALVTARLQHPGIVPVYEAGRWPDGTPFYAMKLVSGRTLRALFDERATPAARLSLLPAVIAICEAVAYAHSERVIHRDLKPSNVVIGAFGEAVVIDWGLAKDLADDAGGAAVDTPLTPYQLVAAGLTLDGAVLGTPAYMAPEQARGEEVDARSDVYALGAILYELLAGGPPYPPEDAEATLERARAGAPVTLAVRAPRAPRELVAIATRAMARDASARYADAGELAEDLKRFQTGQLVAAHAYSTATLIARWVRRHRIVLASVATVTATILAWRLIELRDLRRRVDAHLARADVGVARANDAEARAEAARRRALAMFDGGDAEAAERVWDEKLAAEEAATSDYAHAGQELETAVMMDGTRADARRKLAATLDARARIADANGLVQARRELLARLAVHEPEASIRARWEAPAHLALSTEPPGGDVRVAEYVRGASGRFTLGEARSLGRAPLARVDLAPGSYLLTISPGNWPASRAALRVPLRLARGEDVTLTLPVPDGARLPRGFVYVPAGRFLFGSAGDETWRKNFLFAQPLHEVRTAAYLIAENETTFGEWIAFLNDETAASRARHVPRGTSFATGQIALVRAGGAEDDDWEIRMTRGEEVHRARVGEPLRIGARTRDWSKLPALGISAKDAEAYAAWLSSTGRVPGARLCTEEEWERAARGADERLFPHGDAVAPEDANFDETYRADPAGFAPDEVGSHPSSDSPFGVHDMAGNGYEWVRGRPASGGGAVFVLRGGGYKYSRVDLQVANRNVADPSYADPGLTLRVCADAGVEAKVDAR